MLSFLALYRGDSIQSADLVAVSTDDRLVAHVAGELLRSDRSKTETGDQVTNAVRAGKRRALECVRSEAEGDK